MMDLGDHVTHFRFLVRDRAGQFTASFDAVLTNVGIQVLRIPPRCPRANCFAGTVTLRAELPDGMLIFGRRYLRTCSPSMFATTTADDPTAPATFARHGRPTPANRNHQRITRRPVLGGLINEYERVA
jgi:putative transposase